MQLARSRVLTEVPTWHFSAVQLLSRLPDGGKLVRSSITFGV